MEQILTQPTSFFDALAEKFRAFSRGIAVHRRQRRLRLVESLSLGERRFLAVVIIEGEKFLVGGGSNSLSLLTRLARPVSEHYELSLQPRGPEEL